MVRLLYTLETLNIEIWKLLVIALRKYITSRRLRMLCITLKGPGHSRDTDTMAMAFSEG